MITLAQLTGAHRRTYRKIFHQPISTGVRRKAVRSLMEALGEVADSDGDNLEITRNGHVLVLLSLGENKTESPDELVALQHFLQRSEAPLHASNGREAHLLLVIGHHEARVFRAEIYGGFPQQILPHRAHHTFRIADSDFESLSTDGERCDGGLYFEPIAQALCATGKILIFGDRFIGWLKRAHPDLAERIIGSMVLDEDQVNSGLLLAKAREFYAHSRTV
jgi:hypothetical protein